ncbi:MAG TPA: condensation domain-containing protein, partial [Longimicrobiaceae bacterium]|nr:condensation domain-containing protein [Longimicrobiaceae bacterium]
SFAQERLWFVDRLIPGSSAYNIPVVLPVPGIDADVLQRVLAEIVRRHESLRTVFASAGGTAVQVIHPAGDFHLAVVDAPTLEATGRLIAEESNRPFDLARGPLFRATLVRHPEPGSTSPLPRVGEGGEPERAGEGRTLILVMHHIVSDGWSMDVLTREMNALYGAFAAGQPSPLPEPALQYADFAVWQRAWMTDEVVEKQAAYWKAQLTGAPSLLELPTDRPRPAVQSFRGATVPVHVSRATSQAVDSIARAEGATPFMVLLAAYYLLLGRYSGQEDVVVGSPIAGRNRGETEEMIGFFVNNLVLRGDLGGDPGFRALVHRVKEVTLGAYAHQDLPFERLVEELNVGRSLAHAPLFQVMFALQNTGTPATLAGAPQVDPDAEVDGSTGPGALATAKFDLTLNLTETPGGLFGSLEYSTDLFDEATARRTAAHYVALLDSIAADADAPISRLPMFTPGEREQVVAGWNRTEAAYEDQACIHEVLAARAALTPHAPALVFQEQTLTHAELDARANQLAHHLRRHGVGAETVVAISVDRSLELVVAMLGVMKAGGAYLPIDPAYPADRRAYMLEDSGAPVVITQAHLADRIVAGGADVVVIDAGWPAIARESTEAPAALAAPENVAYVIYTSGSTGRPKGVMVPHRGVVSLTRAAARAWHLEATDHVLQFASFSFDAAVWEILTTLRTGACLHLAPQQELMPGTPLVDTLAREGITVALLLPSALGAMPDDAYLPHVRTVICGGEALSASVLQRWRRRHGGPE